MYNLCYMLDNVSSLWKLGSSWMNLRVVFALILIVLVNHTWRDPVWTIGLDNVCLRTNLQTSLKRSDLIWIVKRFVFSQPQHTKWVRPMTKHWLVPLFLITIKINVWCNDYFSVTITAPCPYFRDMIVFLLDSLLYA